MNYLLDIPSHFVQERGKRAAVRYCRLLAFHVHSRTLISRGSGILEVFLCIILTAKRFDLQMPDYTQMKENKNIFNLRPIWHL